MKSQEFRIGNYVIDLFGKSTGFDNYIVIVSDLSDRQEIRARNITGGHASIIREMTGGITLTEEWLINARFENKGEYWNHMDTGFEIMPTKNGFCVCVNFCEYAVTEPFNYVHELQNAFHVFERKELKFNL